MLKRLGAGLVAAWLVGGMASGPAAAQSREDDLQKQIDDLRAMLQAIEKDVAEVKQTLARQMPRPRGIGATIDVGDRPARGEASAKVTLVEFSDYQCPFCASYVRGTYPAIEAAYIKTGKVRTVFFDTPLANLHKNAFKAAQAAACAREQGRYWEMHDRLFQSQAALEPWDPHAEALGLDVATFRECLDSGRHDTQIRHDMGEGQRLGATSTPTFLIGQTSPDDGTKVKVLAVLRGALPFADFKAAIDPLLEAAATAGQAQ